MWIYSRSAAQLKGEGLVWIYSRECCSAEGGGPSVAIKQGGLLN